MIRCQAVTVTDAHEKMTPAFEAMKKTDEALGRAGPTLFHTDNPTKDKQYLLEMFPGSLGQRQKELDVYAEERNNAYDSLQQQHHVSARDFFYSLELWLQHPSLPARPNARYGYSISACKTW